MKIQHTPGPWRWEINESSKSLSLVGGKPMYDLTIIQPTRWGTRSATLMIRDTAHDGMNIMHKLHERRDWIKPFHGRSHHADWCANVIHPDMCLIAAAPELLAALVELVAAGDNARRPADGDDVKAMFRFAYAENAARAAISKAIGSEA